VKHPLIQKIEDDFYGPHDFIQTSPCGRGQHHPHGLVGRLWRVKNPNTVRIGDCFLKGRLKTGDLFLCIEHSGDCFQDYIYVKEFGNGIQCQAKWNFGSYGIGDADPIDLPRGVFEKLREGKFVEIKI
jgi:hypothetical protein